MTTNKADIPHTEESTESATSVTLYDDVEKSTLSGLLTTSGLSMLSFMLTFGLFLQLSLLRALMFSLDDSSKDDDDVANNDMSAPATATRIEVEDSRNEKLIAIVASVAAVAFILALVPLATYAIKRYKVYRLTTRVHSSSDPFSL